MANVIIKTDEQRADQAYAMQRFGLDPNNSDHREAAEVISRRTSEAYQELRKMEEKYSHK